MLNTKKELDRHVQEIFRNMKDGPEKNLKCLNVARRYFSFEEYEIAKKYVSRYLNEKETAPARKLLGQCYEALNQLDKALIEYKTSLELLHDQKDLVLKVCELILRTESKSDLGRTRYWCDRLEKLFPHHQMVFKLKEFLLKAEGSIDWNKLETLILAEIKSRPNDVTLRERILRIYLETGRHQEAYKHGIEIEKRHLFRHSLSWYQCLADVFKAYQSNEIESLIWEVWIHERLAYLSLDEHLGDENAPRRTTLNNANSSVYLFDQKLHQLSQANFSTVQYENHFYQSYLNYLRAQLTMHLATLVFKTSKSQKESWREVSLSAIPLLLFAYSAPTPAKEAWYPHVNSIKRQMAQIWNLEAAYRKSQAGHILIAILQHRPNQTLAKVSQQCYGNWRENLYKQLFTMRDQAYGNQTSHFVQDSTLSEPPQQNPSSNDLRSFDDLSQKVYPNSLHHLVWLGLQTNAAVLNNDPINPTDFQCQVFEELQLSCSDLNQSTLESLDKLDCEAFLHASVLCAKSGQDDNSSWASGKNGLRLPACITSQLCSVEQAKWWSSAYDVYKNKIQGDFGQMRVIVQRGIEVIRALGNHGLDVRVIVHLARIFTHRAQHFQSIGESRTSEAYNNRAAFFWRKARVLLQQTLNNVSIRKPHHILFNYQGKELNSSEALQLYDEARFFLACENMKQNDYDEALSQFDQLTSPMASYYQAQIYIKLADKQISNVPREVITSEMRSLHIIYLTKARDALYLTSDRLRSPLVNQKQPINLTERLAKDIEDIETRLRRIKPDCFTNDMTRQDIDGLTDEETVSTVPSHGGGAGDIIGNGHFGASYYATSSTLLSPKHHESQSRNFHSTPFKINALDLSHSRTEARPSPERLDAQLRQLMATNDSVNVGVQVVLRQLLEEIRGLREDFNRQVNKQGDDLSRQLTNFSRQLNDLTRQCTDQWDLWEQRETTARQLNEQFLRNINEIKRDLNRGRPRPTTTTEGLNSNQANSNNDMPLLASDGEDDMYVFGEEEYSDEMNLAAAAAQIGQYPNFPGYTAAAAASAYRQMTGVLGSNTVTYGAPPPLPPPTNAPPQPPPQFFRGVDPSLMYAPMGYYPTQVALPFSEGQQLPDFRTPFTQPPPALPTPAVVHPKAPVNVVITSSDTLPTSAPPTQPPLSVTIPPQHRLGTLPPTIHTTQNTPSSQPHQFQISMPSQPTLPQSALLEQNVNLNPIIPPNTSNLLSNVPSPIYSAVTPDKSPLKDEKDKLKDVNKSKEDSINEEEHDPQFEPLIQMPEVDVKTGEEEEEILHECRAKLFRFTEKEWKERGVGQIKILKNIITGKIRVLMRRDQVFTICANHFITPDMELKFNSVRSTIWSANDFADEEMRTETLCARFKTTEDANSFKEAWDAARINAPTSSPLQSSKTTLSISTTTTPIVNLQPPKLEVKQTEQTTKLGGFIFNSPPSIKEKSEIDNKPKDKVDKPSPFASFSFSTSSLTGTKSNLFSNLSLKNKEEVPNTPDNKILESKTEKEKSNTKAENNSENLWINNTNSNLTFSSLIGSGSGFKTDTNFKGFAGAGTPLFSKSNNNQESTKNIDGSRTKENKDEDVEEFIPTTEFTPVIPLPDLVEQRTGEEGYEILWEERVKLLRFDNEEKQWKERGVGKMKILHDPESGLVRLLMRREQVFKLCCNQILTSSLKLNALTRSNRAWTWYAQDYSEGVLNMETLAIKLSNPEQANAFKKFIEDIQSRMENDKLFNKNTKEKEKSNVKESVNVTKEENKNELKPLSELFKPKTGSWECKSCFIRNEESASQCIACQTPNPNKTQDSNLTSNVVVKSKFTFGIQPEKTPESTFNKNEKEKSDEPINLSKETNKIELKPLSELFKPKTGSWECKSCFIRNEESASQCIACQTPSPNKTQDSNSTSNVVKSKFTFGIQPEKTPESATNSQNISNTVSSISKFTIGTSSTEKKDLEKSDTLSQNGSNTKFTFANTPIDKNNIKTTSVTTTTSSSSSTTFSFISAQTTNNMFSFGNYADNNNVNQTGSLPSLKDMMQPKLRDWICKKCFTRNEPSVKFCISCESDNPNKSPLAASHNLDKKSIFSSGLQNGSFSLKFGDDSSNTNNSFNFGNSNTNLNSNSVTSTSAPSDSGNTYTFKFSGIREKSPGKSPTKSPGAHLISGDEDSGNEASLSTEDVEGDQIYFQPIISLPNVLTETGEENEEILYESRSKLFRFHEGEWKERGVGTVKLLKHKETGKIRILMRRDQVLKICANHYITLDMRLAAKDEKTWIWAAQDFSEGELIQEKLALRFKSRDIANDFKEAFLQAQSYLGDNVQKEVDNILSGSNNKSESFKTLQSVQRSLFTEKESQEDNDEEEIQIVFINEVTPEEKQEARKLLLPDNFYLYKKLPGCTGCRGCEPEDQEQSKPKLPITTSSSSSMNTFTFTLPCTSEAKSSSNQIDTTKTLFGNISNNSMLSTPTTFSFGQKLNSSGSIFGGSPNLSNSPSMFGGSPNLSKSTSIFGGTSSTTPSTETNFPSLKAKENSNSSPVFPMKFPESSSSFGSNNTPIKFGGFSLDDKKENNNKPFGLFGEAFKKSENVNQNDSFTKDVSLDKPLEDISNSKDNKPSLFGTSTSNVQKTPEHSLIGNLSLKQDIKPKFEMDAGKYLPTDSSLSFASIALNSSTEKANFLQETNSNFKWSGSGTPLFSSKSPKNSETSPENTGEYDPYYDPIVPLPEIVEVKTGEEDETVLFSNRAKLFRFDQVTKEWKERGVGDLKILHNPKKETYRLLLRREQVHKLVLNQLIKADLDINPKGPSEKAFVWNGPNFIDDQIHFECLSVLFKNPNIASLFYDNVRDCLERLRLDPAAGHVERGNNQEQVSGNDNYTVNYESREDAGEEADDDEDDEVDREDDEDDEYEEEEITEPVVEKRATVKISGIPNAILGDLSIVYHSTYGLSALLKESDDEEPKLLTPFLETENKVKQNKTECTWSGLDYSRTPHVEREISAKFSSESAAGEFAEAANYIQ